MFAYSYKRFIHFIIVLGILNYSHLGYTNVTIEKIDDSAETSVPSPSNKTDEMTDTQAQQEIKINIETSDTFNMPDHKLEITALFGLTNISNSQGLGLNVSLMGDILYRIRKYDRWNSSLGLRYRVNLGHPESESEVSTIRFHQLTFLIQNLVFIKEKLFSKSFIGPVLGIHIWKSFKINYMNDNTSNISYQESSEFFWNYFSYQFGMKSGLVISSHFAFTMEIGFDQLGFRKYKEKANHENEVKEVNNRSPFNNTYITLGISYFL